MRKIIGLGLVLLFAGCGTEAPTGLDVPDGQDVVDVNQDHGAPCLTGYWNQDHGVGFNPPSGMIGPVEDATEPDRRMLIVDWYLPGDDNLAGAVLVSYPTTRTLEEAAARLAQIDSWQVFKNEPITLNSGRPGWVIADKSWEYPDDLMSVTVILVWNGVYHNVTLYGSIYRDTYDYDYLLSIGRSLCAE